MARRRRPKNTPGRDTFDIANLSLPRTLSPSTLLSDIEDNRQYHPEGADRSPRLLSGNNYSISVGDRSTRSSLKKSLYGPFIASQTKAKIIFSEPDRTLVCLRRKQRKEILHAKRKTGRGGRPKRSPRRNWKSDIACR